MAHSCLGQFRRSRPLAERQGHTRIILKSGLGNLDPVNDDFRSHKRQTNWSSAMINCSLLQEGKRLLQHAFILTIYGHERVKWKTLAGNTTMKSWWGKDANQRNDNIYRSSNRQPYMHAHGHGDATTRRPSLAARTWWWWSISQFIRQ